MKEFYYNNSNWEIIAQGLLNAKDIDPGAWADCERVMNENKQAIEEEFFNERLYLSIKQPVAKEEKVVGIIVLSIDITEKRQSEIAKKEFIENMSHDLRTPFTGILSLTEYLYSKRRLKILEKVFLTKRWKTFLSAFQNYIRLTSNLIFQGRGSSCI